MKRLNLFFVVLFFASTIQNFATPEKGSIIRQALLGANKTHYFTLTIIRGIPNSHYAYDDSTFIYAIDLRTNRVTERKLLRATHFERDPNSNVTQQTEQVESPQTTFGGYLKTHHVSYAFPSDYFSKDRILLDENGLYMIKNKTKVIKLLPPEDVENLMTEKQVLRLHFQACLETRSHFFLQFSGTDANGYSRQILIPLKQKFVKMQMHKFVKTQ